MYHSIATFADSILTLDQIIRGLSCTQLTNIFSSNDTYMQQLGVFRVRPWFYTIFYGVIPRINVWKCSVDICRVSYISHCIRCVEFEINTGISELLHMFSCPTRPLFSSTPAFIHIHPILFAFISTLFPFFAHSWSIIFFGEVTVWLLECIEYRDRQRQSEMYYSPPLQFELLIDLLAF